MTTRKIARLRRNQGLTLLEVLIAMVIMSVALLLLLNMGMVALAGNDWSNNTTTAMQLVQQKMEELQASSDPQSGEDEIGDFARQWEVSVQADHLRQIDIEVTWTDLRNAVKTESLTTLMKTDSI